jgi:hypothetical protein
MKHSLLIFVFFLVAGHLPAQSRSSAILHIGYERGMYWDAFSPYIGVQYQYEIVHGIYLNAGLGYVQDRAKTYGGAQSEFHRIRSTQPYAGLQLSLLPLEKHHLSVGTGLKLIALRMNYVENILVVRNLDERTVTRLDYNVNQPAATFSLQHDYHFSERLFAGLQLQLDYLLQKEDLEPLSTSYLETSGFSTTTVSSTHPPQSLGRFTMRLGYRF